MASLPRGDTKLITFSLVDRIANQKFAVRVLVTLYSKSRDIPGRTDTLRTPNAARNRDPTRRFIKQVLKDVRVAATSTTMALGNVASEIAGSSVLQPNSPSAIIQVVLESPNKSRLVCCEFVVQSVNHVVTCLWTSSHAAYFILLPSMKQRAYSLETSPIFFPIKRTQKQHLHCLIGIPIVTSRVMS